MGSLGSWMTIFKVMEGFIGTSPIPATLAKDLSAVAIFL